MTETILDESAVSEIEARLAAHREEVAKYRNHEWAKGNALHYYEAPDDVAALCATVKHLRERERTILAVNAELIDGNHAAHVALDSAGIKREDVVWEGPIQHVTEYPVCDRIGFLQSQLEQLRAENERLLRGDFTDQELQGFCHNLSEQDQRAFFEGCTKYQQRLFGTSVAEQVREEIK